MEVNVENALIKESEQDIKMIITGCPGTGMSRGYLNLAWNAVGGDGWAEYFNDNIEADKMGKANVSGSETYEERMKRMADGIKKKDAERKARGLPSLQERHQKKARRKSKIAMQRDGRIAKAAADAKEEESKKAREMANAVLKENVVKTKEPV